jgi:hypothetical protein
MPKRERAWSSDQRPEYQGRWYAMSHLSRAQDYHREQGSDNRMWSCRPVLIGVAALGIVVWHQARKGWKTM